MPRIFFTSVINNLFFSLLIFYNTVIVPGGSTNIKEYECESDCLPY